MASSLVGEMMSAPRPSDGPPLSAVQDLEDRYQECKRLSRTGPCCSEHILAFEGERKRFSLDIRHVRVASFLETSACSVGQGQLCKLLEVKEGYQVTRTLFKLSDFGVLGLPLEVTGILGARLEVWSGTTLFSLGRAFRG